MITLTRRQARGLRGVFRRHVLGPVRGTAPPLVLWAEGPKVCARYRYGGLAVAHEFDGDSLRDATVFLPLDALAEFEGPDETAVTVEAVAADRTAARWVDRGVPQAREYAVPAVASLSPFPEAPASWSACPAAFLDALAEAARTGADDTARYALDCLQIKAADGGHEVVTTDGHQLFVQGGFPLPWTGDVLVRRSPVFACKALPRDRPLSVGRTESHVVLRAGAWTLFLEVVTGARFPDVSRALPAAGSAATRVRLDPDDARFLLATLDRLPGGDDANAPVTLDVNGSVAVRARGAGGRLTELVLTRSAAEGPPLRLDSNRAFLGRALRLGFTTVELTDPSSPAVCRAGRRVYAWQPLDPGPAPGPDDSITRIRSDAAETPGPTDPVETTTRRVAMNGTTPTERRGPNPAYSNGVAPAAGATNNHGVGPGLAALIAEADALHAALGDAKARAAKLAGALRRYRKRERLVSSTLASLRELRLAEAAGP
jgi:hypothetical protein